MDLIIFNFFHGLAGRSVFLDALIVGFASYVPFMMLFGAFFFVWRFGRRARERFFVFCFLALSTIIARGFFVPIIRFFYHRPRPFVALEVASLLTPNSYAFPSGHAAFYFALALAIFSFQRRWGICFLVLALFVGVARVAAGAHWPSDIVGGIATAAVSWAIVSALLRREATALYAPLRNGGEKSSSDEF